MSQESDGQSLLNAGDDLNEHGVADPASDTQPAVESPSSLLEVNPPASFISTIFHQDARVGTLKPDIVLVSTEGRLFYAHRDILHHTSVNQFCGLLLLEGIMCGNVGPCYALAEDSGTINVLLHTVYHLPFTTDVPPLQAVLQAVDALHKYGFPPKRFVAPYTPLFIFLLSQSPRSPMDVFLTATKYGLENLAVIVSSHLLAFPVSEITDEMASKMGAVYLRRLLLLLVSRAEYLRQLLFVLPKSHPRTLTCGFVEQKMLEKEWIVFAAELSGRVRPDFPEALLRTTLNEFISQRTCAKCKEGLDSWFRHLVLQWSLAQRTI